MALEIMGRLIAVSQKKTVASSDQSKEPVVKREIYIDCTRYDQWGQRSQYENKPVLEFSGEKVLAKVGPKLDALQKGDIVKVSFDIQGVPYTEKGTGKQKVFTTVRCFDIDKFVPGGQAQAMIQAQQAVNGGQGGMQQANLTQAAPEAPQTAQQPSGGNGGRKQDDDLPF